MKQKYCATQAAELLNSTSDERFEALALKLQQARMQSADFEAQMRAAVTRRDGVMRAYHPLMRRLKNAEADALEHRTKGIAFAREKEGAADALAAARVTGNASAIARIVSLEDDVSSLTARAESAESSYEKVCATGSLLAFVNYYHCTLIIPYISLTNYWISCSIELFRCADGDRNAFCSKGCVHTHRYHATQVQDSTGLVRYTFSI